jgi:glycine/D-amino acid oxidase-like deaminating enzyme
VLRPTFGLHPLKYVRGLAQAAAQRGAGIHARSEVVAWDKDGADHVLTTSAGGALRAKQVIVAANGFMPEHLREQIAGRTLPMISAIVVTRPMTEGELARHAWRTTSPSYTARNLLDYFRVLPDGRLLFGGRGSASGDDMSAGRNFERLIARLHQVFPRWHGLVCMTRRLTPGIGRLDDDPSVFFGFGYHGNGVSAATWSGKQLARWIAAGPATSSRPPEWLPAVVHGLPGRFPLAGLRLAYIRAAIASLRVTARKRPGQQRDPARLSAAVRSEEVEIQPEADDGVGLQVFQLALEGLAFHLELGKEARVAGEKTIRAYRHRRRSLPQNAEIE